MDNRKLILSFYTLISAVVWILSRGFAQWLHSTFYEIRRLPGASQAREILPGVLAIAVFVTLVRHPRVNLFMEEVVSELRKVTFPSREDVVRSTVVVLACILICSAILGVFDAMFGKVIGYLLKS